MSRQTRTQAVTQIASIASPAAEEAKSAAVAMARAGLDRKAEDVVVLDVRGLTSYADYFVLLTGNSDRQVEAIADAVQEKLRAEGQRPLGVEGQGSGRWVLLDYGDVVAHVLYREAREFYDLDGLWADAARVAV